MNRNIVGTLIFNIRENGLIETLKKIKKKIKDKILPKNKLNDLFYDSNYQANIDFSGYKTDLKPICFYLPQFHTFKENDEWWGRGFTEWTNTRKAYPRYKNHYQPREPHDDIGYYTLDNPEIIKKQAKLAKEHGIYGFCFYYYWFSGKRLMEKPLDIFIENKDIDINFCICWANENWTRTWDGAEQNVLIKQEYSEKDKFEFVKDCIKYIRDERYIKIDGKPLIIVYNPQQIKDRNDLFHTWREEFRNAGIGEVLIWICQLRGATAHALKIEDIVDGEVEFPPHMSRIKGLDVESFNFKKEVMPKDLFDYKNVSSGYVNKTYKTNLPVYKTVTLGWDNSARRKHYWVQYVNYSLKYFYNWVVEVKKYTNKALLDEKIFFINAWNEWAEGTYLEPDKLTGYANINTFSKALCNIPINNRLLDIKSQTNSIDNEDKITLVFSITNVDDIKYISMFLDNIHCKCSLIVNNLMSTKPNSLIFNGLNRAGIDVRIINTSKSSFERNKLSLFDDIQDSYIALINLSSLNLKIKDNIVELANLYEKSLNYVLSNNENVKLITLNEEEHVKKMSKTERKKIMEILLKNNVNIMVPYENNEYINMNNVLIHKDVIGLLKHYKIGKFMEYIVPMILEYNNIQYKEIIISK